MRRDDTLRYWWTLQERSHDSRTGAVAELLETAGGWAWRVTYPGGAARGTSTSQKGARAAARRYVRSLPSVAVKPDRQLPLFK